MSIKEIILQVRLKKFVLIALLCALLICNETCAIAATNSAQTYIDTGDRYAYLGTSADYGPKIFWVRFSHGFELSRDDNNAYAKNHAVQIYKLPVDNIYPSAVGNGTVFFSGVRARNSNNQVVDSTSVTGNYGATIDPAGTIVWYRARSTNNEYVSVPAVGTENSYYLQASMTFTLPDGFALMWPYPDELPKTFFY